MNQRSEYVRSIAYRAVFILSGFRRLIGDSGSDFAKIIEENRVLGKHYVPIDENFIVLVDNGFEYLSEPEIRLYAQYIRQLYGIQGLGKDDFYKDLLMYCEAKIPQDFDSMYTEGSKAVLRANAISALAKGYPAKKTANRKDIYEALLKYCSHEENVPRDFD